MNRRLFLRSAAAIAATAVLDPERLLFVPGRVIYSIPKRRVEIPSDMEFAHWLFRHTNVFPTVAQLRMLEIIRNREPLPRVNPHRTNGLTGFQTECIRVWRETHA